jgi:hypothetical protein
LRVFFFFVDFVGQSNGWAKAVAHMIRLTTILAQGVFFCVQSSITFDFSLIFIALTRGKHFNLLYTHSVTKSLTTTTQKMSTTIDNQVASQSQVQSAVSQVRIVIIIYLLKLLLNIKFKDQVMREETSIFNNIPNAPSTPIHKRDREEDLSSLSPHGRGRRRSQQAETSSVMFLKQTGLKYDIQKLYFEIFPHLKEHQGEVIDRVTNLLLKQGVNLLPNTVHKYYNNKVQNFSQIPYQQQITLYLYNFVNFLKASENLLCVIAYNRLLNDRHLIRKSITQIGTQFGCFSRSNQLWEIYNPDYVLEVLFITFEKCCIKFLDFIQSYPVRTADISSIKLSEKLAKYRIYVEGVVCG